MSVMLLLITILVDANSAKIFGTAVPLSRVPVNFTYNIGLAHYC